MLMPKAVATIRTLILLLAGTISVQAFATDITVTVAGSGAYCSGITGTVNFDGTGTTFTGGNTFTVELSDAGGSFAAPAIIGTLSSTSTAGAISVTWPVSAIGSGYRLRIVSSNPSITGSDNGADLNINTAYVPTITITPEPGTTVGAGSSVYFSSSVFASGIAPTYTWKRNGVAVAVGNSYVLNGAIDGETVVATVTSSLSCASPATATSNTVTLDVDGNLTRTNHSWEVRASQPDGGGGFIERSNASGFSIGSTTSKAYIGCGSTSGSPYLKDFWAYNPADDTWTQVADLGQPATATASPRYNAVGFTIGTKGYVGTGITTSGVVLKDFYEYNPANNQWAARLDLPGVAREQAIGFAINGSVMKGYIGGGNASGSDLKDFYEYNPSGNTWTPKADFGGGRRSGSATFAVSNVGYVAGGYSSSRNKWFNDLWSFDGSTWTQLTSMPGPGRTRATGFSLAGNGYVGMGNTPTGYDGHFYQYKVSSNTWSQKTFFPGPTSPTFGAGMSIGNRAFVYKDGKWLEYNLLSVTAFPSKMCTSELIPISFDASGFVFGAGNLFIAQMSSGPGFSVSTTLGTLSSTASTGTVQAVLPAGASGTYYFRLTTSAPVPVIVTFVETITVTGIPATHNISVVGGSTVCVDVPVTFNSLLTGTGFQWYQNDQAVGTDSPTFTTSTLVNGDAIKASQTFTEGCTAPVEVMSLPITMVVRTPPTPTVTVNQPNILTASSATGYQWYESDEPIPQATSQSYSMTGDGVYKVRITDTYGCNAYSEDIVGAFTGLEDDAFRYEVTAYPSPFNSDIYISISDDIIAQGCHFSLMNEMGQTVVDKQPAQEINRLELSGKTSGLYVLRVSFGQNTVVRKLIKVN